MTNGCRSTRLLTSRYKALRLVRLPPQEGGYLQLVVFLHLPRGLYHPSMLVELAAARRVELPVAFQTARFSLAQARFRRL
jgi:hypothetical protein